MSLFPWISTVSFFLALNALQSGQGLWLGQRGRDYNASVFSGLTSKQSQPWMGIKASSCCYCTSQGHRGQNPEGSGGETSLSAEQPRPQGRRRQRSSPDEKKEAALLFPGGNFGFLQQEPSCGIVLSQPRWARQKFNHGTQINDLGNEEDVPSAGKVQTTSRVQWWLVEDKTINDLAQQESSPDTWINPAVVYRLKLLINSVQKKVLKYIFLIDAITLVL